MEVNVLHILRCESVSKMMMMMSAWKLGWAADRIQRLADRDGGARNFPTTPPSSSKPASLDGLQNV